MNSIYFLVQQTMFFSIPLLVVALGGMFSERSGIVNIALEGIMIMGAFVSIFTINILQDHIQGQLLLIIAILVAALAGMIYSLLHAYASVNMKANQVISGTALNMFAPAFATFVARMIQDAKEINFVNTFRIESVPLLGKIPVLGPLFFQNTYITTYLGLCDTFWFSAFCTVQDEIRTQTQVVRRASSGPRTLWGINVYRMRYAGRTYIGARWQALADSYSSCRHPPAFRRQ